MAWSTRTASPVTSGPGNEKVELIVRLMRNIQLKLEMSLPIPSPGRTTILKLIAKYMSAKGGHQLGMYRSAIGSSQISVPLGRHFVFLIQRDELLLSCFGFRVRVRELSVNTGCKVRKRSTSEHQASSDLATAAASLRSTETRNPGNRVDQGSPT